MKKFALLTLFLVLTLGMFVLPAAAQDQDLTTLAGYLPADAPVYVGLRTDDAFISTLDALATRLGTVVPGGMMRGSIQESLDQLATEIQPGGTFATTIRPWLGDTAAFGIYALDPSIKQPFTVVFSVKDQDKAETLFDTLLTSEEYALKDGDGYTVYSPKSSLSSQPNFIFRSDVLIVTTDQALVESGGVLTSTLGDNAAFSSAIGLLPASQYNAVIYADTPSLLSAMMKERTSSRNQAQTEMVTSMLGALKPQAIGLTLLDDRSLTVDVAAPLDATADNPMVMINQGTPINPDFAQHILAGTPLVAQGTDLYDNYQHSIDSLRALAQNLPANSDMKPEDVETGLWGLEFLIRGLTGLPVQDAIGWMTGDYAITLGFTPAFTDAQSVMAAAQSMPLEFGIIVAATDSDAAQKVFDGLSASLANLPDQNLTVKQETLPSGANALSLTLQNKDMPFPVEIVAAAGNGVFAIGTPRTVNAALDPANQGLSGDAAYTEASKYLLSNPGSLFYLSGSGLEPLARVMTQDGNPLSVKMQGQQIQAVLSLISSASVSETMLPDKSAVLARLVWTLPE